MLKNDANLEETEHVRGVAFPGSIIPQSSLLGRDRFGDEPLPEACYTLTNEGDAENDEGDENQDNPKEYSQVGLLVKATQDQNRACIRVVIYDLIDKDMATALRRRESEYRRTPALRNAAPRGEMPWKEYKRVMESKIRKTTGMDELTWFVNAKRANGQSAVAWVHQLDVAVEELTKVGHTIADATLVDKAIKKELIKSEMTELCKAYREVKKAGGAEYTMDQARTDLPNEAWESFLELVNAALEGFEVNYKDRSKHNSDRPNKKRKREKNPKGREKKTTSAAERKEIKPGKTPVRNAQRTAYMRKRRHTSPRIAMTKSANER